MHVNVEVDDKGWAATFNTDSYHPLYIEDKLAFEARRLVREAS